MKIYATCQCCTKKNFIIDNYKIESAFSLKTEFGARLFESLKKHLESIQQKCQEQGHYDRIWIELDSFSEEEKRLPLEIIETYLPTKKKEKKEAFTLKEGLEKEKITPQDYKKLIILFKGMEEKLFTGEEIEAALKGEGTSSTPPSKPPTPLQSPKIPPTTFPHSIAIEPPIEQKPKPKSPTFQEPEYKSKPKTPEPPEEEKTLLQGYLDNQLSYKDYQLLITPGTEGGEGEIGAREIELDSEELYNGEEVSDYLQKAKEAQRKREAEEEWKREIRRRMEYAMNERRNGKNIHPNLDGKTSEGKNYIKNGIIAGFTYDTCKEGIDIGMQPHNNDYLFCAGLKSEKKLEPMQVINLSRVNLDNLRTEGEKDYFTEYE